MSRHVPTTVAGAATIHIATAKRGPAVRHYMIGGELYEVAGGMNPQIMRVRDGKTIKPCDDDELKAADLILPRR